MSPAHCVVSLFSVNNTSFPRQSGLIYGNNGRSGDEKHNNAKWDINSKDEPLEMDLLGIHFTGRYKVHKTEQHIHTYTEYASSKPTDSSQKRQKQQYSEWTHAKLSKYSYAHNKVLS